MMMVALQDTSVLCDHALMMYCAPLCSALLCAVLIMDLPSTH